MGGGLDGDGARDEAREEATIALASELTESCGTKLSEARVGFRLGLGVAGDRLSYSGFLTTDERAVKSSLAIEGAASVRSVRRFGKVGRSGLERARTLIKTSFSGAKVSFDSLDPSSEGRFAIGRGTGGSGTER